MAAIRSGRAYERYGWTILLASAILVLPYRIFFPPRQASPWGDSRLVLRESLDIE